MINYTLRSRNGEYRLVPHGKKMPNSGGFPEGSLTLPEKPWYGPAGLYFPDMENKLEIKYSKCPPLVLTKQQKCDLKMAQIFGGTDDIWEPIDYTWTEDEQTRWGDNITGSKIACAWENKKTGEIRSGNFAPVTVADKLAKFEKDWKRDFDTDVERGFIPPYTQPNLETFLEAWGIDWKALEAEYLKQSEAKEIARQSEVRETPRERIARENASIKKDVPKLSTGKPAPIRKNK